MGKKRHHPAQKRRKVWAKRPTTNQPLYRVKIGDGYYSANHPWKEVSKELADKMTHAQALRVRNHMKHPSIRYKTDIELVDDERTQNA